MYTSEETIIIIYNIIFFLNCSTVQQLDVRRQMSHLPCLLPRQIFLSAFYCKPSQLELPISYTCSINNNMFVMLLATTNHDHQQT